MRWLLGIAGLSALGAATMMSVVNAGGISAPMAPGIFAMTIILAVGSAAVSYAHAQRFYPIAIALGVCMLISESGAGLMTARRVMENREAFRAPLAELATKRKDALAELAAAEAAQPVRVESSRVTAADAAQKTAEAAVRDKAADKGCRENCRMLLQSAVDAAQREVAAARIEFDELTRKESVRLEDRRTAARAEVAALPPARSATPLSDETGVPERAFDIWEALALSIGLNIPGSLLIGLAVNGRQPGAPDIPHRATYEIVEPNCQAITHVAERPIGKVPTFMLERVEPLTDDRVEIADLFRAYGEWCQQTGCRPLAVANFADALMPVIEAVGIRRQERRGHVYLVGVKLAS